jgi:hypothetical protein
MSFRFCDTDVANVDMRLTRTAFHPVELCQSGRKGVRHCRVSLCITPLSVGWVS